MANMVKMAARHWQTMRTRTSPRHRQEPHSLGDLKKNIEYIIGMERQSGNIDTPTPQDIASLLNVPIEEVELSMNEMGLL